MDITLSASAFLRANLEGMMRVFKRDPSFKFKLNSQMISTAIMVGISAAIVIFTKSFLGIGNAMAFANCFMLIWLSLGNDYTTKFAYNTGYYSLVHVGLGVAAWAASFNLPLKVMVIFVVNLYLVYRFNRGKRKKMYMQLMINFVFYIYYPVHGMDFIIRLVILEGTIIAMMIVQYIVNKKSFRRGIRDQLNQIIDDITEYAKKSEEGILQEENDIYYKKVDESMTRLGTVFFDKFAQINQWKKGNQYLRILSILKSLNHMIYRASKEDDGLNAETFAKVYGIIRAIDNYNFEKDSFEKLLADIADLRMNSVDTPEDYFIESEIETFLATKEEDDNVLVELQKQSHFNKIRFLYSLKTAIMSSVGVMIIALIGLPYEYWYPINIAILAQPFYEFNRKKSASRLVNTVISTIMLFVAFHITDIMWLRLVIIAVLVIVSDIFLSMDFFTLYVSLMALIMGYISGKGTMTELSALRIGYVIGTSALVLIVDSIISPRNLKATFLKRMDQAEALNNSILNLLVDKDFTGSKLKELFDQKTVMNTHILNLRPYYSDKNLDAYSLNEQTVLRMYNLTYEYLVANNVESQKIQSLFLKFIETRDFKDITEVKSDRSVFMIYEIFDIYEAIQRSNEIIEDIREGLTAKKAA